MNELSLFTGAGGGLLGTKLLGFRPIGYVEWDGYCQAVIAQRIKDGFLEEAPIFGDVREFVKSGAAREYRGFADVVTAGFPCQPFSVAGKQQAAADERNMWPATADVLREVRPRFTLLENVPGLLGTRYASRVFADLAALGFDAEWGVLSAAGEGAPHARLRLFILAHTKRDQQQQPCDGSSGRMGREFKHAAWDRDWQVAVREFRGVDDGMAYGVERTDAIRNGQVPSVVVRAWTELSRRLTT